jgi:hypothetical protein
MRQDERDGSYAHAEQHERHQPPSDEEQQRVPSSRPQ